MKIFQTTSHQVMDTLLFTALRMGNGEFIENVPDLEANYQDVVLKGYNVRGRVMFKEKLNLRLQKMTPLYDFIKHTNCVHNEEWEKPAILHPLT